MFDWKTLRRFPCAKTKIFQISTLHEMNRLLPWIMRTRDAAKKNFFQTKAEERKFLNTGKFTLNVYTQNRRKIMKWNITLKFLMRSGRKAFARCGHVFLPKLSEESVKLWRWWVINENGRFIWIVLWIELNFCWNLWLFNALTKWLHFIYILKSIYV